MSVVDQEMSVVAQETPPKTPKPVNAVKKVLSPEEKLEMQQKKWEETQATLIQRLRHTACRVGVSKIHGVGLIAVRPIAKGEKFWDEEPKKSCHDHFGIKHWEFPCDIVDELEKKASTRGIADMVDAYLGRYDNDHGQEVMHMPESVFDRMHPIWYMNHSAKDHNVKYIDFEMLNGGGIVATKNIKIGEEILSNYNDMFDEDDPEYEKDGDMIEDFPNDKTWVGAKAKVDKLRKEAETAQNALKKAEDYMASVGRKVQQREQKLKVQKTIEKEKALSKLKTPSKSKKEGTPTKSSPKASPSKSSPSKPGSAKK